MVSKKRQTTPPSWVVVVMSAWLTLFCGRESMGHEPRNFLPCGLITMLTLQEVVRPRAKETARRAKQTERDPRGRRIF